MKSGGAFKPLCFICSVWKYMNEIILKYLYDFLTSSLNVTRATRLWGDCSSRDDSALWRASWIPWRNKSVAITLHTVSNPSKSTNKQGNNGSTLYLQSGYVCWMATAWCHLEEGNHGRMICERYCSLLIITIILFTVEVIQTFDFKICLKLTTLFRSVVKTPPKCFLTTIT